MKYIQFKEFNSYFKWYKDNSDKLKVEKIKMLFKKNNKDVIKVWYKDINTIKRK